ncbi:MAG TPA: multidrug transporter AcrB, partial [Elusimicrobia bacterium]|nr:multidrug transporter AcrB [Elusimicrobiota bacterium]
MSAQGGVAGAIAGTFIRSKLTPLIVASSLLLGAFALLNLPREEEPQINVPMFDVFVPFPGASPAEVEERIINVGERRLWEIPGVEYIYSTAEPGGALFIVRFQVGTNPEEAANRIYTKTSANLDMLAPGAPMPLIKPRSIDDVPILALTLTGEGLSPLDLRRAAAELRRVVSTVDDVSDIEILGGRRRQFSVLFDPRALARRRLSPLDVVGLLRAANRRLSAGTQEAGERSIKVEVDAFLRTASDVRGVVLGVSDGRPVRVGDVAEVVDGPDEDEHEAAVYDGAALGPQAAASAAKPAVTLAVSKRRGANATEVSRSALARVAEALKLLPSALKVTVTRDYGDTAKRKSDELLYHMFLATLSVTLLIALALGWREALVVLIAVPVTLALTLMVYWLFGYTFNRITLFALIFSIGILVDDAIVVVENIVRHTRMAGNPDRTTFAAIAIRAVDEVGNPTILATLTVVAAILPMAFVGGLMGPYMRPIPVGATAAMLFSLLVAFMVTPWAATRALGGRPHHHHEGEDRLSMVYRRAMGQLVGRPRVRQAFLGGVAVLLVAAVALVPLEAVTVKMLPFDNKSEFQVGVDMPEGSTLER